jgi:hypothetical protein
LKLSVKNISRKGATALRSQGDEFSGINLCDLRVSARYFYIYPFESAENYLSRYDATAQRSKGDEFSGINLCVLLVFARYKH